MGLRLVVLDGPDQGKSFELAGIVVLGRDPSVGIVLDDPEVSRRHVSMSTEDDRIEVKDLDSMNGTWIAGERIEAPSYVSEGDKVRVGHTVLQVVGPAAETAVAEPPSETRVAADTAFGPRRRRICIRLGTWLS